MLVPDKIGLGVYMVSEKTRPKCIILLSTKSSGSSALQRLVCKSPKVSHLPVTRHKQNETLYWVKAASLLEMSQVAMTDSEVPISVETANSDLKNLLESNLDKMPFFKSDSEMIYKGWCLLCEQHGPVLFEKSPHHLHQSSAINLILECVNRYPQIEFLIVGLVRNPMDTIYSRWYLDRTDPEKYQYEWMQAYINLIKLRTQMDGRLSIIRYEDMVTNDTALSDIYNFVDDVESYSRENQLHRKSIAKWKRDNTFGFQLNNEVINIAGQLGYQRHELANDTKSIWPLYKMIATSSHSVVKAIRPIRRVLRQFRHNLASD